MIKPLTEFKLSLYVNGLAVAYHYHQANNDFRDVNNVKKFISWIKKYGSDRRKNFYEEDIEYLKHYLSVLGGRKPFNGFTQRSFKNGYLSLRDNYVRKFVPPNFKELVESTYFVVDVSSGEFLRGFDKMSSLVRELGVDNKKKVKDGVYMVSSKHFNSNFVVVNVRMADMTDFTPFIWREYKGLSLGGVCSVSEVLKREEGNDVVLRGNAN